MSSVAVHPEVSIIVPARNEEVSLRRCLESLVSQTGVSLEIIVVDDASTDGTCQIAESFAGVQVVEAGNLRPGWTGKNNAVFTGAARAHGSWLLFTDADTSHQPGSLAAAIAEAQLLGASLLSYSPKQEVRSFWEKALMPVVFAELASAFRPSEVSDPESTVAAANGQYLLISRDAYDAVGGHATVAASLLEDVELARVIKASGRRIYFRYGADAVSARMYRNFSQLREGWTKNLALLFPSSLFLAISRLAEFGLILGSGVSAGMFAQRGELLPASFLALLALSIYARFLARIRKAHFPWDANLLSVVGLPFFAYLLFRSRVHHGKRQVSWKGRTYSSDVSQGRAETPALGCPDEQRSAGVCS